MKLQKKLKNGVDMLEYFTQREWEFTRDNWCLLKNSMNEVDSRVILIIVCGTK